MEVINDQLMHALKLDSLTGKRFDKLLIDYLDVSWGVAQKIVRSKLAFVLIKNFDDTFTQVAKDNTYIIKENDQIWLS